MAEISRTSLSAGLIIRKLLTESEAVTKITKKIYPVVIDKAILPYILYRRTGMQQNPVKGYAGASTEQVEVICYAKDYDGCIALSEAVRSALDNKQGEIDGLRMRSCLLTDSEEGWEDDAHVQRLVFTIKI